MELHIIKIKKSKVTEQYILIDVRKAEYKNNEEVIKTIDKNQPNFMLWKSHFIGEENTMTSSNLLNLDGAIENPRSLVTKEGAMSPMVMDCIGSAWHVIKMIVRCTKDSLRLPE